MKAQLTKIAKAIEFIRKYDLLVGTFAVIIVFSIFYRVVLNYGEKTGEYLIKREEVILKVDTVYAGVQTAYVYDSYDKVGVVVHPKKYNDIHSFSRIYGQLRVVKNRAMAHNRTILYFIIHLYYFIVVQTIFMIIVLLLGVTISKKGWGDSSDKLLGTFLICAGILLFFQVLPKGMKMEENLAANRGYYKIYCSVENDILTYLASDKYDEKFVSNIDLKLEQYHAISFDLAQVPFSEVRDQFEEIKKVSEKAEK